MDEHSTTTAELITSAEVMTALGLSRRRVLQMDAVLRPVVETLPSGRKRRRYPANIVRALARRREAVAIVKWETR